MTIYDKALWHIDAGENPQEVISKFAAVFAFLHDHNMLTTEGEEVRELGLDDSISLHERLVTDSGKAFMEKCYDEVINMSASEITDGLNAQFQSWRQKS